MKRIKLLIICTVAVLLTVFLMGSSCDSDVDNGYFLINCKTSNTASIMPGDSIEIKIDVKNVSEYTMGFYPVLIAVSDNEELLSMITFVDGFVQEHENSVTVEYSSVEMESQESTQFVFQVYFSHEITNDMANSDVSFILNYYRKNETFSDASKVLVNVAKELIKVIIGG